MNEIDEIMSMDPLEMTTRDVDVIVAYHRNNRARSVDGKAPKPEPKDKVDLSQMMKAKRQEDKPAGEKIKRRV